MKKMKKIKKIVKSRIFLCIITAIIVGSLSAGAATYFASGDVSYDNSVSGLKSTDVQSAIDELYNECFPTKITSNDLKDKAVTNGDGLYIDSYEKEKYIYRGSDPNNYIIFNDEMWRIMSIETDGSIKIIKNTVLLNHQYDSENGRYQGSSGYCNYSYGCNIWGSKSTLFNASEYMITKLARQAIGGTTFDLPTSVSDLNTYLNTTYYNNTLSDISRSQITKQWFNVGIVAASSSYTLNQSIEQSKIARWKGNIGLIDVIEYVKASTNSACDSVYDFYSTSSCYNNPQNYLNISKNYWTISPYSDSAFTISVFDITSTGKLNYITAYITNGVRPALSLKSDITLTGEGTESNPYTIVS